MSERVIVIAGVGPGLGAAIARRFGQGGYAVGLVGRTDETVRSIGEQLQGEGITAGWTHVDMTDDEEFAAAVRRLGEHTGHIDHLHFNPSAMTEKDPLHLTAAELLHDVHLGVASLLTAVQAAHPYMSRGGRITATGSITADRPWAGAASLGVQKAGLRNLVGALDATLRPNGIRAMTFTIMGTIGERAELEPDRIADALFTAGASDDWQRHVSYPTES